MLRKLIPSGASRLVQRSTRSIVNPNLTRAFSSTLNEKEKGDESRYFKEQDAALKAQLKAKLDAILELEDSHEQKAEVLELLSEYFFAVKLFLFPLVRNSPSDRIILLGCQG